MQISSNAESNTFTAFQGVGVSYFMSFEHQVSTDELLFVGLPSGSIVLFLQPTITISLPHGEGTTTFLFSAGVVTITESLATETPYISTPVVNVVLNFGCKIQICL